MHLLLLFLGLVCRNLIGETQAFADKGLWLCEIFALFNISGAASEFERVLLRSNGLLVLEVGFAFGLGLLAPHFNYFNA